MLDASTNCSHRISLRALAAAAFRARRTWRAHTEIVLLALIPVFYLLINPSFGQNRAGDIDTWFYFGLAKSFWHQLGPDFYNDYYETRLPYIIPAAIIFAIQNGVIASWLWSYFLYCCCAFSLFYVFSTHVSKPAALLATTLMASDVFFLRAAGWQYVDGGVLAYGSLAFAALAAATRQRRLRYVFIGLSSFLSASMVIVHLGSAPFGIALLGYAFFVLDIKRLGRKEVYTLLFSAALGVLGCQVIYGVLNVYLYHTQFLFEREQILAAKISLQFPAYREAMGDLLTAGWWLTAHIGAWVAAAALILAKFAKLFHPSKFQSYCMWAVFSTYSILFTLDYFHLSLFLGRSGLYVSTYLFLSYMFVGAMLPRVPGVSLALIYGSLFLLSLAARLQFAPLLANALPEISAFLGVALGVVVVGIAFTKNRAVHALSAPSAALLLLPVTWAFSDQGETYAARAAVAEVAGDRLPYFAFSESDPAYAPVIIGLVGSFTPRAWWIRCNSFPDCVLRSIGQKTMFVVSSNPDAADISSAASAAMPELALSSVKLIYQSKSGFSVYRFALPRMSTTIAAAKLPSRVGRTEGDSRVATEHAAGYLTFGPHAAFEPGRYELTIEYAADGETGSWDVVTGSNVVLARGSIPDTHGATGEIVVILDLPDGAEGLEARTLYSGHGRLSVLSLGTRLLSDHGQLNRLSAD